MDKNGLGEIDDRQEVLSSLLASPDLTDDIEEGYIISLDVLCMAM